LTQRVPVASNARLVGGGSKSSFAGAIAVIARSEPSPDAAKFAASSRITALSSCAATHRFPALSKASPCGLPIPRRSTVAVGFPFAAICAAVSFTTLPSAMTETHRFPVASNATTFGPGRPAPNDGLSMTTSGALSPSVAKEAAP